ncbi:MAG: hypothetical protein MI923_18445 [Phycisphaerales bacterium]|nr:hypothetical protein [Phycisphaerales bacterium]
MCNSSGWIWRSVDDSFSLRNRSTVLLLWTGGLVLGASITGCQGFSRERSATEVFKVQIDRQENGAAQSPQENPGHESKQTQPRRLAFEVTGFGRQPLAHGTQERRAAARQAAIIDAFCKALIEARRSRGQPASNFTAKLGQHLTVAHRDIGSGDEFEVRLVAGGAEKRFIVQDGVLQHLPHDFKLIHKLFDETRGEFSLLPTGPSAAPDTYVANVGYYLPVVQDGALAGRGPSERRGE